MSVRGYLFKVIKSSLGQQIFQDKMFRHGGRQSCGSGMCSVKVKPTHQHTNLSKKFQRVLVGSVYGLYFLIDANSCLLPFPLSMSSTQSVSVSMYRTVIMFNALTLSSVK